MKGNNIETMKNGKGKLLLADANSGLREAMTRNLQKAGYGVIQARNVSETLRVLTNQQVRTAFLDEHLPGMTIMEGIREIRRQAPNVNLVVFADDADRMIETLAPLGVQDVLSRPVSEPRLLLAARRGIESVQNETAPEPRQKPQIEAGEILPFRDEEKRIIERALRITGGNIQQTAKALKLGRATIYRKLRKYDIHPRKP